MFLEVDKDGHLIRARRLRRLGVRKAYEMQMAIATQRTDAEELGRSAISSLVQAFLVDRVGEADLFAVAHRIGRDLSQRVGCRARYDAAEQTYTYDCPIHTLHANVATSIGWIWEGACSICSARILECEHVPGELYDGEPAYYKTRALLRVDHLALTAQPDFHYTWIVANQRSAGALIAEGTIRNPGEAAVCNHCEYCYGCGAASAEDLDPVTRWNRLMSSHDEP
jgi:hypothetical protein